MTAEADPAGAPEPQNVRNVAGDLRVSRHSRELPEPRAGRSSPAAAYSPPRATIHRNCGCAHLRHMLRLLIALYAVLFSSVGAALDPRSDLPAAAFGPATVTASWHSDDIWGIVVAVVAMAVIIRRRDR